MLSSTIKVVTVSNTANYPDVGGKIPLGKDFSFSYGNLFARSDPVHTRSCSKSDV